MNLFFFTVGSCFYYLDISRPFTSTSNVSVPTSKISKIFSNKFGKSLSNFKSNVSKVFHPRFSSTETVQHLNTIEISSPRLINQHDKCNIFKSNLITNSLESLQNENRLLKELINEKENLFNTLKKTFYEERLKYQTENMQLKQIIERLEIENLQLRNSLSFK